MKRIIFAIAVLAWIFFGWWLTVQNHIDKTTPHVYHNNNLIQASLSCRKTADVIVCIDTKTGKTVLIRPGQQVVIT